MSSKFAGSVLGVGRSSRVRRHGLWLSFEEMLLSDLEKHKSRVVLISTWSITVPHIGSWSTQTHSVPSQDTGSGLLFCSQDCQKDLSTSHVLLNIIGRPNVSIMGLPWIVHSKSTIRVSPFIILSGLRMFCQISYELVVRFDTESLKKPNLWSTWVPTWLSKVTQLLSTVNTQFSCSRVTDVSESSLIWETFHLWGWPPVLIVTSVPAVIGIMSGKDCCGVCAIFSSREPRGGWLMMCCVAAAWLRKSPNVDPFTDPFVNTCGCVETWGWVGTVSPIEEEASSSSQFQSSISTSGYSGVFTWGSSRLRPRLVAGEYNYSQQQYYVHLNVWIYYRCITSILLNNNTMYPYFGDYTVDELL